MTLSRRQFLGRAAQFGLGAGGFAGAVGLAGGVSGGSARAQSVRSIRLEARAVSWELAPGKKVLAMAYNGQVPGPEIRVREGDRLRVSLESRLPEPTTIHWHGVEVPNAMDGVGGVTQTAVGPGRNFVYEFEARRSGTRWYHTHVEEHRQMDMGLAGPLIIEPSGPEPMTSNRDVTLILDDWRTGVGTPVPPTHDGAGALQRHASGAGADAIMPGDHATTYDTMTINGKAYPATERLLLTKGERVRLRLINASAEHTHVLRLAGHRLHVTHTDGNPLQEPVEVGAIPIAPSERYDAVVAADRPGAWTLSCLQPGHAEAGERMLALYKGHEDRAPEPEPPDTRVDLWHYGLGRGRQILTAPTGATRELELALSGGMDAADRWTLNGKAYPNTDPLVMRKGDRARVRFVNVSPHAHPMHLHGQPFAVTGIGRVRFPEPIIKDSVDVAPYMGSVTIEFTATNPGTWLLHCHKARHMEGGMMMLVKIT